MEPSTPGERLHLIRRQYGDLRKAESLKAFAARVEKATGVHYDPSTLSLLERMEQSWRLEDADTLCLLDKERRGSAWILYGIVTPPAEVMPDPANGLATPKKRSGRA